MTKYLALVCMLSLCACGGGSGGGHVNRIDNIADNDVPVESMVVSVNNRTDAIAYAVAHGVAAGADYETVVNAFQNMYEIATGINTNPTEDELRSAYALADGDPELFDVDTAQAFIAGACDDILLHFFAENDAGDGYVWEPINQTISDIEFNSGYYNLLQMNVSGEDIISFKTSETGDVDDGGWLVWTKGNGNTFNTPNRYEYEISEGLMGDIWDYVHQQGGDVNDDFYVLSKNQLNFAQVKEGLVNNVSRFCDSCDASTIGHVVDMINNMSESDVSEIRAVNLQTTLHTYGKEVGLSYADFGYTETTGKFIAANGASEDINVSDWLYGGYDTKVVERPDQDMVFTGSAVANIEHWQYDYDTDEIHQSHMISHTTDARLTLSGDSETLEMNFSSGENPWYDVTVNKATANPLDQTQNTLVISNTNNVGSRISPNFRMTEEMVAQAQDNVILAGTYLGDNWNASEAISLVDFEVVNEYALYDDDMNVVGYVSDAGLNFGAIFGGKVAE